MAHEFVVHIVEDDQPMRDSLAALLKESGYKVRAYATAEELLHALHDTSTAGCVVSDVRMPGMDGLALLRCMRAAGALPLVLISGHSDIAMAVGAMKAGAVDFLEKPFEPDALIAAVESALRFGSAGAGAEDAEKARRRLEKLTSREYEVLGIIVGGKSNKEAAAKIGISPRTVEFHRAHIMEKTGARGLPELVRLWLAAQNP
jgi:two-component system, LuxR family, response regulator FixJ